MRTETYRAEKLAARHHAEKIGHLVLECPKCKQDYRPGEEPDPCLGEIPGVEQACCGHGRRADAYVMWENGLVFRGFQVEHHGEAKSRRNNNR